MELGDLSLDRRVGAAVNVIWQFPSLDIPQRHALVAAALWPDPTVTLPQGEPAAAPLPHATARERQAAVELVRGGVSTFEVADRYAVAERTVRRWVSEAAV